MCGIVGYLGPRDAAPVLLEGLHRLEYRGYDSAGISILTDEGLLTTVKKPGKISVLEEALDGNRPIGTCGIAHTRWATHGAPTEVNAHPHFSADGDIALVHNGIIENADELREDLQELGYEFRSETDTEVIIHLIDEAFKGNQTLEDAVAAALLQVEGAYGIAVVSSRDPGKIVAARHGSPLLLGIGKEGEYLVGSDAAALVTLTRDVVYLDDGDVAVMNGDGHWTFHLERGTVSRPIQRVTWDLGAIEKEGFDHFMLKEIFEQPSSLRDVLRGRLLAEEGVSKLGGITISDLELLRIKRIIITACGTSWHSALLGEYMIEELARVPVEVEYASEFRYKNPLVDETTLVVAISQSGETADTLAALREAKRRGAPTMGIVNAVGSTIARETDFGLYLHAGPEIGVASTSESPLGTAESG
jgi:glucosamine--fructose-6-phosphate aminotransferase (isomerizing)